MQFSSVGLFIVTYFRQADALQVEAIEPLVEDQHISEMFMGLILVPLVGENVLDICLD